MKAEKDPISESRGHLFELSGGALCLDYVNTLGDRPICCNEHFHEYGDLLNWSLQSGALPSETVSSLARRSSAEPDEAGEVFLRAVDLRETLFRIFSSVAGGERPDPEDLTSLNDTLKETLNTLQLCPDRTGDGPFRWHWEPHPEALDAMLGPIAYSAGELLTSCEADFIRQCDSPDCSWLFVDRSRTRRRRWCDMKTCGNRAKARRHYRKKHQGKND